MAQMDAYLVEKLREILQRLYSSSKPNGFNEKEQALTPDQEQPVTHKRSPSLFHFAPSDELSSRSSASEIDSSEFTTDSLETDNRYFENNSSDYYNAPDVGFNDSSSSPYITPNYSNDSAVYGTEVVNCTTSLEDTSVNRTLSDIDKIDNEDDSSALTRSLHEFIHILKMSLKSGTTQSHSNNQGIFQTNGFHSQDTPPESYGIRRDSLDIGGQSNTNPFSGIEALSTANMEYNLTLDDIMDLNSLLEGDDTSSGLPLKHVIIIATYFIIACVSIVGNLLVIQLVIRSRRFHTLTHALLANLAAADLVLATINIPFSCARVIMSEWPFGPFLCRAVPFLQVTSVYATSFTMAVIEKNDKKSPLLAMDRYQVIMNPLGKRLKCSQGILLVIAIWTISAVLSLPYALNHKVVTILTVRVVKRCQAEFGFPHARQLLTVATFLAQYLLPLVFTTVSYICIMKRLWHRSSDLGSATPRQVAAQSKAKLKTIKMLILTVFFFAVTWLPIHLYHLFTHFSHVRHNSTAILICHIIAMSSSMYNPFIFCGLNEHFRREAVKWLRCFRTRRSPVVHPGMEVNGMITRADQTTRRNLSTTVIHTTVSSRRSPQHQRSMSPRSGQRRGLLATSASSTTAAIYMTPRHTDRDRGAGGSPTVARLVTSMSSTSRNGSSTSGYQPELLFLVKDTMLSQTDNVDLEGIDSIEEDINAEDFLDSLGDEMGLYQSRGKKANQYVRDNDDDILSQGESTERHANDEEKSDGEM